MTQERWWLGGAAILPVGLLVVACGGSVDLFGARGSGSGGASQTGGAGSTRGGANGSKANGATSAQTNGASDATGTSGTSGTAATAAGDAGAPAEQQCGVGVGPATVPQVDAAQSAKYNWSSCGRIAPAGSSLQALYAHDGAILSLEEGRGVRVYTPGMSSSAALVNANSVQGSGLSLGDQGARLLLWDDAGARVFVANDQQPIGFASGMLTELVAIDTAAAGCGGQAVLSADGTTVVAQGADKVCAWDVDQGALVVSLSLGAAQTRRPGVVAVTADGSQLKVFRDGELSTYATSGERVQQLDLTSLRTSSSDTGVGVTAAFTADADALLLFNEPAMDTATEVVAIDTTSGAVRWRAAVAPESRDLSVSASGYVLVAGDAIYRTDDGEQISPATPAYGYAFGGDVDARGLEMIQAAGPIRVWDLAQQKLRRLYGGHSGHIYSLDVSRDGSCLASHDGRDAITWQLDSDFAQSIPLFNGRAEGTTQIAVAPDGSSMLSSGDVVALFGRDGVPQVLGGQPPGVLGGGICLSTSWDYAPNGCVVSGMRYSKDLQVYDARGAGPTTTFPTRACAGVAFSPDSSRLMTAKLELFDTSDWSLVWSHATPDQPVQGLGPQATVAYSPDGREVVVASCADEGPCQLSRYDAQSGATLGDLPQLSAARARYSPEGHWIISGGRVQHLPSGKLLTYDAEAKVGVFAPNGDIIAGEPDGSLVRYCRSNP